MNYLEMVSSKSNLNLTRVLILRLFKMVVNQIVFQIQKRSVIKFLVIEKCKPCLIYKKLGYVKAEVKKMLTNVFATTNFCRKDSL